MDLARVKPFWGAGFGPYDHTLVHHCIAQGLTEHHLTEHPLRGRDIVRRLSGGESVAVELATWTS